MDIKKLLLPATLASMQVSAAMILIVYAVVPYFAGHRHKTGNMWTLAIGVFILLGLALRKLSARRTPVKAEAYKLTG